jgi:hypothetical protein
MRTAFRLQPALACVLLGLALGGGPAQGAAEVKGPFRFGKLRFQPADALAYREEGQDPAKLITLVTVTDFPIDRPAVMEAIDTATAIWQQAVKKGNGNIVTVKATGPDECGVSAYISDGSQHITLGDGFPARWKASSESRVTGECFTTQPGKMFDDVYEFRLSFDVPVTAIPKPSPVPAGGGAPGLALVALVNAIRTADWKVARLHLREEDVPATPPKASEMKDYFHGLALNFPKTARVTGGLIKGDLARIEIRGTDNDGKRIRGVFEMRKTGANWRVLEWNMFFVE